MVNLLILYIHAHYPSYISFIHLLPPSTNQYTNSPPFFIHSSTHRRSSSQRRREPILYQCRLCKNFHGIRFCRYFINMDVRTRNHVIHKYSYCVNCLANSHNLRACTSRDTCRRCGKQHHTLLHPGIRSRLYHQNHASSASRHQSSSRSRLQLSSGSHHLTSSAIRHQSSSAHRRRPASSNHRPALSNSHQSSIRRRQLQSASHRQAQPSSSSAPDQRVISEAIRSLAQVLCVQPSTYAPGGRNV